MAVPGLRIESLSDIVRALAREGYENVTVPTEWLVQIMGDQDVARIADVMAPSGIGVEFQPIDMTYLFYRNESRYARQRKSLAELKRMAAEREARVAMRQARFRNERVPDNLTAADVEAAMWEMSRALNEQVARALLDYTPAGRIPKPTERPFAKTSDNISPKRSTDPPPRYTRKIRLK